MPLLQVRDCPDNVYQTLVRNAKSENRSIAQQTIVILKKNFDMQLHSAAIRRQQAIAMTEEWHITLPKNARSPAELVREDRDR